MNEQKAKEVILLAPTKLIFNNTFCGQFQGSIGSDNVDSIQILNNLFDNMVMCRRGIAEENVNFKQPIPYVLIKRGDELYVYERLTGGGEQRLHSKLSLGLGGHMNEVLGATSMKEIIMENLKRELTEEVKITHEKPYTLTNIGIVNDDVNDVGKHHICLLYMIELEETDDVEVLEVDQLRGYWAKIEDLKNEERLEEWSKISVSLM